MPGESELELWPRLLRRQAQLDALQACNHDPGLRKHTTLDNVHKLLHADEILGSAKLPPAFARALLTTAKDQSLDEAA